MTTVVIRSQVSMFNPDPDTPYLPDIESDIRWRLLASDLDLSNGDPVESWLASGPAPTANKLFDFTLSSWDYPEYSASGGPNGGPAVTFDGTQQIANQSGASSASQPTSYALVVKTDVFADDQSRLLSSANLQVIRPTALGYESSIVSSGSISSGKKPSGWTTVIAVFNGANSYLKVGLDAPIAGSLGTGGSGRTYIGGQPSTLATAGLVGAIAEVRQYSRALSVLDMEALAIHLQREYGIL